MGKGGSGRGPGQGKLSISRRGAIDSGPVAGFDGSWTISKRGIVAQQPGQLTRSAVQKATAHCAASGKRFRQLDLKESPPGTLSSHAESELKFACE